MIEQVISKIYSISTNHFGDVKFVGIKYQTNIGWIAKIQFVDNKYFNNLTAEGDTSLAALKNLKKRIKKIISRYNVI
jgi:uncharacterized protein YegL